jgi:nucleotide-binding universal stress UspA family protein
MNIRRVLFPTDFSHYNDAALEFASTLAAEANARLDIVHVDEMRDLNAAMADSGYPYVLPHEIQDRPVIRRTLAEVLPAIPDVQYQHHYLKGNAVSEIIEFANRENIDLIVMASHGRTGLLRLLMGSVAEGVMRKAPCPVLVVKHPSHKDECQSDSLTINTDVRGSHE